MSAFGGAMCFLASPPRGSLWTGDFAMANLAHIGLWMLAASSPLVMLNCVAQRNSSSSKADQANGSSSPKSAPSNHRPQVSLRTADQSGKKNIVGSNNSAKAGTEPAPSTSVFVSCPSNSSLKFNQKFVVPAIYDSEIALCKQLDTAGSCTSLVDFEAFGTSKTGEVKPACILQLNRSFAQFGIDSSQTNSTQSFVPAAFFINGKGQSAPLQVTVASAGEQPKHVQQLISGNFSQIAALVRGTSQCSSVDDPCQGYIQNADGSSTQRASFTGLSQFTATVEYDAPQGFKPSSYLISYWTSISPSTSQTLGCAAGRIERPSKCTLQSQAFSFSLVQPQQQTTVNFTGSDLEILESNPECHISSTNEPHVTPSPNEAGVSIDALIVARGVLVARVIAPAGYIPNFVVVSVGKCQNLIARRSTSPPVDELSPNITFSAMDVESVRRNFGERINANYLVEMVEAHNPTPKKLQLNKSGLWFDVDYIEAYPRKSAPVIKRVLGFTVDSRSNELMIPGDARVFRYGIDQTQRQYPDNFAAILGTFDATGTSKAKRVQGYELVGSLLSGIAAAEASIEFSLATHLIAGVLIPGVKGIAVNPEDENRKRSNLVSQGLQNIIEVPPYGTASTLVFLPRKGLLSFVDRGEQITPYDLYLKSLQSAATKGASEQDSQLQGQSSLVSETSPKSHGSGNDLESNTYAHMSRPALSEEEEKDTDPIVKRQLVPVMIKTVREINWDPQVISEVNAETVAKGVLKLGMTKDQVRQAIGEPDTVTTESDKTSKFLYSGGQFKDVSFNVAGLVEAWTTRSLIDQVAAANTYEKIRTLLLGDGPSVPIDKQDLVDGSFVWFDAPQISQNLRFDSKGTLIDPNYKEAFLQISPLKGKTKKDFDSKIESLALDASKDAIAAAAKKTTRTIAYPSPDIANETITVSFVIPSGGSQKTIGDDSVVSEIQRSLRK